MKFFRNWPLFNKFGAIFSLILLSLIVNFVSIRYFKNLENADTTLVYVAARNRMLSQKIGFLAEMVARGKTIVGKELTHTLELHQKSLEVMKMGGIPPEIETDVVFSPAPDEIRPVIKRVEDVWWDYKKYAKRVMKEKDPILALQAISYIELNRDLILQVNSELAESFVAINRKKQSRLNILLLLLIVFDVCVMALGMYLVRRFVIYPVQDISDVAQLMSKGNLNIIDFHKGKDEIGLLGKALRKTAAVLRTTILDIQSAAKQISSASLELSKNSQQIAKGANQEASAADTLNMHLKTISSASEANAELASRTSNITNEAKEQIREGSQAFIATIESMKQISDTSSVIKDIAFQTNLLAINAAIEAASAGQAGKGFSVVAHEVRKLADQTNEAAKHIAALTTQGVELAEKSGILLEQIIPKIQESSGMSGDIANASNEQNQRIQKVYSAIRDLSTISQQNAASSEEMAASSEELLAQAQQLKDTTEFFKVRDQQKKKNRG